MHTLARLGTCAAAIAVVVSPAATFDIITAAADGGTTVVLDARLRRCDFSPTRTVPMVPHTALGTGSVLIHTAGPQAIAEVHL
ncbi:MAG: hypothetical protein WCE76_17120, partial [Mycobacterium sp.]